MKTIVLVRHAKSKKNQKLKDFERPLKKKGKKDAEITARVIGELGIKPDYIVTSPATRALSTTQVLVNELGLNDNQVISEPRLYLESKAKLLSVLTGLNDNAATIFMVGHNPDLTDFAHMLAPEFSDNIPTSGIVGIQFPVDTWGALEAGKGKVIFSETPKKNRKKEGKREKQVL